MKPEEALARMDGLAGRMERAPVAEFRVDAEALRIVLAMAKAAAGMADALETCRKYIPGSEVRSWPPGHRLRDDALKGSASALAEFRKASGGDAP